MEFKIKRLNGDYMSYKIRYIKKIRTRIGLDNEPYDIYLAFKDGKVCYINDMGYYEN